MTNRIIRDAKTQLCRGGAFILLAASLMAAPHAAVADDAPDKSQYTLFNPVPDNLMRSFSPDRPTKSNSPYTVDAGHIQYETDIVNWTYDHNSPSQTTTSNLLVMNTTTKLGLTQNSDLEVAFAPLNFIDTHDRAAHTSTSNNGIGDVFVRVKENVVGNESGDIALAVVPYVKLPSASSNMGNRHWEGGAYAPLTIALPDDWSMTLQTEVDDLENPTLNGTYMNYQNLINIGHPIGKDLTAYAEIWSGASNQRGVKNQYTVDFALGWATADNLQLDGGINFGLNQAAADVQTYVGISQRF